MIDWTNFSRLSSVYMLDESPIDEQELASFQHELRQLQMIGYTKDAMILVELIRFFIRNCHGRLKEDLPDIHPKVVGLIIKKYESLAEQLNIKCPWTAKVNKDNGDEEDRYRKWRD